MKYDKLDKDDSIISLLKRIAFEIGEDNFSIDDNWESDLCAIAITSKAAPNVLVYISTFNKDKDTFYFELETLVTEKKQALPYDTVDEGDINFEGLMTKIKDHLQL
ncbi:MAG: hypothetical protein ISR65_14485 [Bacteriovoracaceae bacterium]|nr:hypothetical protein [Bacteriovoracaceae bacterium]